MAIGKCHLNILVRKCKDLDPYWKKLGLALGLPQTRIDAITEKYAHVTSVSCMITMLQEWHDSCGGAAKWGVLYVAAQHIGKNALANQIKRVHDLDNKGEHVHACTCTVPVGGLYCKSIALGGISKLKLVH